MDTVLPENLPIPLLGIYPEDALTYNKDTYANIFIADLFIISQNLKDPRCSSIEEWIHNGVLISYYKL